MAYRVVWSSQAVDDVEVIATYIGRDSPSYAAAVIKKIVDITRSLTHSPLQGKMILESKDLNIREQFAYSYRLIYRVEADIVTVTTIIHGKRLLELEM